MDEINQVVYMVNTGTVLPEMQWSETLTITRTQVTLARKGTVEINHINVGSWNIPVEALGLTALFDELKTVDCSTIKRIEASDPPDGGDTETYAIYFENGDTCSLFYDPGTRYENGDLIKRPIEEFIQSLEFPLMAESRYVER